MENSESSEISETELEKLDKQLDDDLKNPDEVISWNNLKKIITKSE